MTGIDPAPCPDCRVPPEVGRDCGGRVVWVACRACEAEADTVADWNARPAPLSFPAPPVSPEYAPEVADAWVGLLDDLADMRATLDGLDELLDSLRRGRVTIGGLRAAADVAFNLSDVAAEAGRAIHDAFPDVVGDPRPCAPMISPLSS